MKTIKCKWCNRKRGLLKSILICPECDYDHKSATYIPNEHLIRDVYPKP